MMMAVFTCPRTRYQAYAWVEDIPSGDSEIYLQTVCLVCQGVHLVNPKTGKVLGATNSNKLGGKREAKGN
jgi:hypothetical protein